jgi:CRISPR-associated protein Cas2
MRWHYLVAYDISDPERLRRVARICRDFGDRVQLSVFACQLNRRDLASLREKLRDTISLQDDQVVFVRLAPVRDEADEGPGIDTLGRPLELRDTRRMIF